MRTSSWAIYSHFGGKKELFAAIVTEQSNKALAALSPDAVDARNLEDTLLVFGRRLLDVDLAPGQVGGPPVHLGGPRLDPGGDLQVFAEGLPRQPAEQARLASLR